MKRLKGLLLILLFVQTCFMDKEMISDRNVKAVTTTTRLNDQAQYITSFETTADKLYEII